MTRQRRIGKVSHGGSRDPQPEKRKPEKWKSRNRGITKYQKFERTKYIFTVPFFFFLLSFFSRSGALHSFNGRRR